MKIQFAGNLLIIACACAAATAYAQTPAYPAKPVRILVGFAAGGGTDVVARILAQKLSDDLAQTFVIDNRPGASGMIAAEMTAKSAPDGYTLFVASQTIMAVVPAIYSKVPYDALRDFTGITNIGASPMLLVVHPSVPVDSVAKLIALAKAQPGQLTAGTGGVGTTPHMSIALFMLMSGVKMLVVPYKGEAPALTDVLAGQISLMFSNLPICMPQVQAGKLRGLAVTSAKRVAAAAQFPTVAESGLPGYENTTWYGLFGPAAMPHEIIAKLGTETVHALNVQDVKDKLAAQGLFVVANTPEQFAPFIKAEVAKWAKVVAQTGVKAD